MASKDKLVQFNIKDKNNITFFIIFLPDIPVSIFLCFAGFLLFSRLN